MCARYRQGLSSSQVALELKIDPTTVLTALRRAGVEVRPTGAARRFHCNDSFFSVIDNEASAYWLGFLAADGCVTESRNVVSLSLQERDRCHVEAFRDAITCTGPVTRLTIQHGFSVGNVSARFRVTSAPMVADLIRHGVVPRKTAVLTWPVLDEAMYPHYLRGYFDGDGWISTMGRGEKAMTWGLIGTEPFLLSCQSYLVDRLQLGRTKLIHHAVTSYIRNLTYGGTAQVCAIAGLMYADATIWLERKRARIRDVTPDHGRYGLNHCGKGHEYSPENTIRLKNGYRACKICDLERRRAYVAKDPERWRTYAREYARRRKREALARDIANRGNAG
jgi:hypothetical protein